MIIEIDGYYFKALLVCDRDISSKELLEKYKTSKGLYSRIEDRLVKLKELLNLREIQASEGPKVDYSIDTDTDRMYTPRY